MRPIFFHLCLIHLLLIGGAQAGESYTGVLPHFTDSKGAWVTRLQLHNPTGATINLQIQAMNPNGSLMETITYHLGPHEVSDHSVTQLFENLSDRDGWLRLEADHPQLNAMAIIGTKNNAEEVKIPLQQELQKGLAFPQVYHSPNRFSGIAFVNLGEAPATVTMRLVGHLDDQVLEVVRSAQPGEKITGVLSQFFPHVPQQSSLEITADQPIAGLGLNFTGAGRRMDPAIAYPWEPGHLPYLRTLCRQWYETADHPAGMTFAFVENGKAPVVASVGLANVEGEERMQPDAISDAGSVTKVFVGALFLQLQEEGILDLDDPVSEYLDWIPRGDLISLRRLLNHTSGLPEFINTPGYLNALIESFVTGVVWTPRQIIEHALNAPFDFDPGTRYGYSNTNYMILGLIAEQVTGDKVSNQFRQRFFEPLGMRNTYLAGEEAVSNRAAPYQWDAVNGVLIDISSFNYNWLWVAGGAVTTSEDMLIFAQALFRGEVLEEDSLTEMLTSDPSNTETVGYGLGIGIYGGELPTYGHAGNSFGGTAQFLYIPAADSGISFVTNTDDLDEIPTSVFLEVLSLLNF